MLTLSEVPPTSGILNEALILMEAGKRCQDKPFEMAEMLSELTCSSDRDGRRRFLFPVFGPSRYERLIIVGVVVPPHSLSRADSSRYTASLY
jgi:hypothetical protein